MKRRIPGAQDMNKGFSIIEILVVMTIVLLLGSAASFYLRGHQTLYKVDDQSLLMADIFNEARQRSLTQRETMRVEIDLTDSQIRLIDENTPSTADDDAIIKQSSIYLPNEVRIDRRSANITSNPPESLPVPTSIFLPSVHPLSVTHEVCTLRFQSNGTVTDAGTNAIGTGAVPTGTTVHVWQPAQNDVNLSVTARAITILGSTASIRLWEYDLSSSNQNNWRDSRRIGNYAGSSQ